VVLLSAGILFCWAGSVDEDGIYGYLLRGGISWVLGRTFIGKILTVCRRRILQSLMRSDFGSGLGIFLVDAPRRLDAGRCNGACHPLPVTRYPGGRNTGPAGTFTPAADSCLHPAGSLVGSGFDPDLANRAGQSPSHPSWLPHK
jgi:hypothetical protein